VIRQRYRGEFERDSAEVFRGKVQGGGYADQPEKEDHANTWLNEHDKEINRERSERQTTAAEKQSRAVWASWAGAIAAWVAAAAAIAAALIASRAAGY
jgi:hypothetical protein